MCLSWAYIVLFYANLFSHTANANISETQTKGKDLEVYRLYLRASKCWQCQQASFDREGN